MTKFSDVNTANFAASCLVSTKSDQHSNLKILIFISCMELKLLLLFKTILSLLSAVNCNSLSVIANYYFFLQVRVHLAIIRIISLTNLKYSVLLVDTSFPSRQSATNKSTSLVYHFKIFYSSITV